ncbi:MAG: MATE family efflux transporter [Clostridia bacterium]|nr:MATE family efflux transporter [Clostridia bacterium]
MRQIDFSSDRTAHNVAASALPMLVAQLLSLLYSIVDRIYIGRIPGEGTAGLGGIGLCFPVIMIVTAFTNLFGMGGAPLCAIARGRKDQTQAETLMNTSFTLLIGTSIVLMAFFEGFAAPALRLFGASEQLLPHASVYLRLYLLGTPATMIASGMTPFINAQGYASSGMLAIFIGAVSNLILDPILIFVLGMGLRGAALATVIAQCLSAVFVILFLLRPACELHLKPLPPSRFVPENVIRILSVGLTSFIMQFTNSLVTIVCNATLSRYGGDLYISIYTIIASVRSLLDVPVNSISDGASPVLSYNYGARRPEQMRKTVQLFTIWNVGYTGVVWVFILLFPAFFIQIFTSDHALIESAAPVLKLYYFAFIFQALQYSGQTVFKALGRTRQAVFFSLLRKVLIVVPLTLLLPGIFGFGARGVFLAEPISNFLGGVACFTTMYITEYRQWDKLSG